MLGVASPVGRNLRVGFKINNEPVSIWSEGFRWTVDSNGYVTISATAGTNGLEWIPTAEGSYDITAIVNNSKKISLGATLWRIMIRHRPHQCQTKYNYAAS